MRLLSIGASGQVGGFVSEVATDRGHDVFETFCETEIGDGMRLDKRDGAATADLVAEIEPDAIIDTGALTDVDTCEARRSTAWDTNARGTRNVATVADDIGAHYVYLSTDYVFGKDSEGGSFKEDDSVSPRSYYARSKYAGEQAALLADEWTIIRPSVVYSLHGENFVTSVITELEAGNELRVVDDQITSPTYAPDLAKACLTAIDERITGLYHTAGPRACTRYDFVRTFVDVFDYDSSLVTPVSMDSLEWNAPRPRNSALNSDRFMELTGLSFRKPREAFSDMADNVP